MLSELLKIAYLLVCLQFILTGGEKLNKTSIREEILDSDGNYGITWEHDLELKTITFQLTVKTLGFVGFGISPNGGMTGADLVIGGVFPNGTSYFSDYYGIGNQAPVIDVTQDWELLQAKENGTHTILKLKRRLNTCDKNDLKISNDTSNLIWAYGKTDQISYHASTRGSHSINLLDPPMPPLPPNTSKWRITNNMEMLPEETVYWCTIYPSLPLSSKKHVIGFDAYLPSPEAKLYTHHFILHECRAPNASVDLGKLIQPLLNSTGDHCYKAGKAGDLHSYCQSYLLAWATGGKRTVFPDKIGYPINEENTEVYYMLQIHYNNPQRLSGIKFETGVDIFYTSESRELEAGILTLGHDVILTQIIPPKTKSFVTVGHCSSHCTSDGIIPESGLTVFNVLLHSHLAGRKLKLRQFRNGKEIAFIANDDHYNFDFQQNRPLPEGIKILPGDQLAFECEYSTEDRENVTLGGLATSDEMCQAFLLYYPRIDMWFCGSMPPFQSTLKAFGIDGVEWAHKTEEIKVTGPKNMTGKLYTSVLNEIDWNANEVKKFQERTRFGNQSSRCRYIVHKENHEKDIAVTYPKVDDEYTNHDSTCPL